MEFAPLSPGLDAVFRTLPFERVYDLLTTAVDDQGLVAIGVEPLAIEQPTGTKSKRILPLYITNGDDSLRRRNRQCASNHQAGLSR